MKKMKEIKAPNKYLDSIYVTSNIIVFLAGSIEMGKAIDWQSEVVKKLKNEKITILNPRRDDWDSSWEQSIKNKKFKEQVEWELKGLEDADMIILNFIADTKSPISLLELGLFKDDYLLVCCPDDFWRKGNVEIVCNRYEIPLFTNMNNLLKRLIKDIRIMEGK